MPHNTTSIYINNSPASFSQTAEKQKQEDEENLSETEKKRQRDRLLMTLQLMQANFELNHGNNDEGRQD